MTRVLTPATLAFPLPVAHGALIDLTAGILDLVVNLRYAPVYDKIKEARRQDDEGPMGDWQRERKVADWTLVIKLASEAIATKSKDLQLAVWLTEALLNKEGFPGLQSGLNLLKSLVENFWDGLYPSSMMVIPRCARLRLTGWAHTIWKFRSRESP